MTANYRRKPQPLGKNLGRRNQAVVPVGAWVEIADPATLAGVEVFVSAQIEDEKIRQRQKEKEARLQQFQRDVKERVREVHRLRRERQLQASCQAVDLQQRILSRSGRGEMGSSGSRQKRDKIYRESNIEISSDKENQEDGGGRKEGEKEFDPYQLDELSQRIGTMVKMAKRELASRQMVFDKEDVPGGKWGKSFTRDDTAVHQRQEEISMNENKIMDDTDNVDSVRDQPIILTSNSSKLSYNEVPFDPVSSDIGMKGQSLRLAPSQMAQSQDRRPKTVTFDPVVTMDRRDHDLENNPQGDGDGRKDVKARVHVTQTRHASGSVQEMVDVRPGVIREEKKRQIREEVLMYRRLFMDMEREGVQENRRKKQNSKRIQRLKKVKEMERLAIERQSEQATEPTDPETGLTEGELMRERRELEKRVEDQMERQMMKERKDRETKRYIRALRAQMKEKMDMQGVTLPPLCPCGITVWDCNPDTCANNCVFYKNPKAYAKALASLLNSSELG